MDKGRSEAGGTPVICSTSNDGGGATTNVNESRVPPSVPLSSEGNDLPKVSPPAYQEATSSSASAFPENTPVPRPDYKSLDHTAVTLSETSPPSYGFVTQSGMQQFQNPPPPSSQQGVQVARSDDSCRHCCSFLFSFLGHLGFGICLVFLIIEAVEPSRSGVVLPICATFLAISYIIIIIESCLSNTKKYIQNCISLETLYQFIDGLKNQRPAITWHVECYHYETRYRTVSYTDSNGNTQYRTESYQEKVVTHRDSRSFYFTHWRDVTEEMPVFDRGIVTRLQLTKSYGFMDTNSRDVYDAKKTEFHFENVNRDSHMSFTESYHIEGFKERMSAYVNEESRTYCMEERWFWLTTLLLVNPIYRCWYSSATTKTTFNIAKELCV